MGRCIIAVQRQKIADGQKGYCVFIHNKELDLYILSIVIDESLFSDDSHDNRVQRKALGIHEFVRQRFSYFLPRLSMDIFQSQ